MPPREARHVITLRPPSREAIARHEAGHALAAVLWVGDVYDVTIVPSAAGRGMCRTRSNGMLDVDLQASFMRAGPADVRPHHARRVLGYARYCLAGWAAESLFLGRLQVRPSLLADEEDVSEARAYIALVHPCLAEASAGWLMASAVDLEYRRARRFLREHWGHVERVAKALLRHETLDEVRFRRIVDRLPWMRHPRLNVLGWSDEYAEKGAK